jgi:2-octaprenyl-6-methoxyphenol hydroxylase
LTPSVTIVGAGPVGLALGLSLAQAGIDCRIIDARRRGAASHDRRVLALSHGSRQALERLDAWPAHAATPIASIHVSQKGSLGRSLIRAAEENLPALGYVMDAGALGAELADACESKGVAVQHEACVDAIEAQGKFARLHCSTPDGVFEMEASLVACAEGAIGGDAGIARRDYAQQAIVATVQPREPHRNRAWERFTPDGPIALLPHASGFAVVWTVAEDDAAALLALDDASFLILLERTFGGRFDFMAASERIAFPLGLRYRREPVGARTAWLGNAAQTLHPVAGQGFNLALRDVSTLAALLRGYAGDPGDATLLARYAAARRLDRGATIAFTDALIRVFAGDNAVLRHARGAALALLDLLPPARSFLARRMIFGARAWP